MDVTSPVATWRQMIFSLDESTSVPTRWLAPASPEMVSGASTRRSADGSPSPGETSSWAAKPGTAGTLTAATSGSCTMPCTMAVTAVSWKSHTAWPSTGLKVVASACISSTTRTRWRWYSTTTMADRPTTLNAR